MDTLSAISTRLTPQSRRAAADQSPNSAGGYTFTLDDAARLRRFLILGVDGGTYYTSAQDLAIDNLEVLERMAAEAPRTLVDTIVEVSTSGAAPRQNPALFALAYATSVPQAREAALAALPRVARTGSHLFTFAGYTEQFRGWGRGLRRAVGSWYTSRTADRLATRRSSTVSGRAGRTVICCAWRTRAPTTPAWAPPSTGSPMVRSGRRPPHSSRDSSRRRRRPSPAPGRRSSATTA